MAREFTATAEGSGRPVSRSGTGSIGAKARAATREVAAEAHAYAWRRRPTDDPIKGAREPDAVPRFALGLRSVCQGCETRHPSGSVVELWDGTEEDARALLGDYGPARKARALREAAATLLKQATEAEGPTFPAAATGSGFGRDGARARFRLTGERRPAKKGEAFISGAIPEAYLALHDHPAGARDAIAERVEDA